MFEDNSKQFTTDLKSFVQKIGGVAERALYSAANNIAEDARRKIKGNIASMGIMDSGKMYNNVRIIDNRTSFTVLVDVPYAVYPEFGTGIYNLRGGGRTSPWTYQNQSGEWFTTHGQRGRLYFTKAVIQVEKGSLSTFAQAVEKELNNAFN